MRITGGVHRSRALVAPKGDATRPTSDRVREALFDILASSRDLSGVNVLDLYAGTGALGLEALSRGAREATLVEVAGPALAAIRANVDALGLCASARVVAGAIERRVEAVASGGPYDVVFADPPYALVESGAVAKALGALTARRVLSEGGVWVLEHGKGAGAPEVPGLALRESRRYGDTVLSFYDPA